MVIVNEAVEFLKSNEPPDGYFLGFSGGKDSTVIYHLATLAGVKFTPVFTNTSIEAPETVKHVKLYYPNVEIVKPEMNLFQGIVKKGLPFRNRRWCCSDLKEKPTHYHPLKHRIFGVRKEESFKRSLYDKVTKRPLKRTNYYPIINWTEGDVWQFIEDYKLPYNELYDHGFSRVGCMICPFLSKGKWTQARTRHIKFYEIFYKWLGAHYDKNNPSLKMTREFYLTWPLWDFKKMSGSND